MIGRKLIAFGKTIFGMSLVIVSINLLLKSVFISSIPPILTNNETYYATEAQAIIAHGTDVIGNWHPWDLAPANPLYSELTGLTYVPGFLLFPHSTQLAIKVVPILMGSLLPVLLGLIVYKLFQRKIFFLTTALVATCNPWIFQFSRMSFDSFPSVFFYCLGMVLILYLKGWKVLWALVPFWLGFYQYQGHKPLLVPLVILTLGYALWMEMKGKITISSLSFKNIQIASVSDLISKLLPAIVVLMVAVVLVLSYLIRLPHLASATRSHEFLIDSQAIGSAVAIQRRLSFQNPLLPVFENKASFFAQQITQRFVGSFDLRWLFQHGNDQVDTFAVTQFGFLYGIDELLILLALWIFATYSKWRRPAIFFIEFCSHRYFA